MKAVVTYSTGRWYGNEYSTPDYKLQVHYRQPYEEAEPYIEIRYAFSGAVSGRGVNWENKGFVTGARLTLSTEEARRLAVSILWQLDQQGQTPLTIPFGKERGQSA